MPRVRVTCSNPLSCCSGVVIIILLKNHHRHSSCIYQPTTALQTQSPFSISQIQYITKVPLSPWPSQFYIHYHTLHLLSSIIITLIITCHIHFWTGFILSWRHRNLAHDLLLPLSIVNTPWFLTPCPWPPSLDGPTDTHTCHYTFKQIDHHNGAVTILSGQVHYKIFHEVSTWKNS